MSFLEQQFYRSTLYLTHIGVLFYHIQRPPQKPMCRGYRRRKWTTATRVQNLDETDSISHSTNTFGKDMNQFILPPEMGGNSWAD